MLAEYRWFLPCISTAVLSQSIRQLAWYNRYRGKRAYKINQSHSTFIDQKKKNTQKNSLRHKKDECNGNVFIYEYCYELLFDEQ